MSEPTCVVGIDPGFIESAFCIYDGERPTLTDKVRNEMLLEILQRQMWADGTLVIEQIKNYGNAMGDETIWTVFWSGRFAQVWASLGREFEMIPRATVKAHICRNPSANDSNIWQALKDRYGGDSVAIGGKKCRQCKGKGWFGAGRPVCSRCKGSTWEFPPGPLAGLKTSDERSALALAITWSETSSRR